VNQFFRYKLDHALFWVLTISFFGFTRVSLIEKVGIEQFLLEVIIRNVLLGFLIYFNLLIVIPQINNKKNIASSVLLILISILFYTFLKNAHDVYLHGYVMDQVEERNFFSNTLYNLSIGIFYLTFASTLYLSREWYLQQDLLRRIKVEKLNTELEYLKAQLNPHFLFNSINTIYFQIDKQNSVARETLSKFSDMLRYQLYECNDSEIPIEKEINYLKNYVELHRLRKDDNYSIQFDCINEGINFILPPLLLLPFVENAFKHVSHFSHKQNLISISLSQTGNIFQFRVFNTKDSSEPLKLNHSGIGLKNVKRRLELLYKDNYSLDIKSLSESFEINLEIKLVAA
jgi:two-component system, LytTR family, sensor kinase